MKLLTALFFLLLTLHLQGVARAQDWKVVPFTSLEKLTTKKKGLLAPPTSGLYRLDAVRGEWESFQIYVTAGEKPLHCSVRATPLTNTRKEIISTRNVNLYWENFVFVEYPSGNQELEKKWWPDALIPTTLQKRRKIEPSKSEVLWCTIKVPREASPGTYNGTIILSSTVNEISVPYSIVVHPAVMPAPSMRANVAVYYEILREWYKKNLNRTFDDKLKKQYYDFLLDYRINAYDLPVPWDSPQAAKYLQDPRVLSVRLPSLDNRPVFDQALKTLRQNNALHKAYYYWIDEPSPEAYPQVRETTQKLHVIDPAIKHCVTAHPNKSLDGAVDIWCPNIGDFFGIGHLDEHMLAEERSKGNETWWYTMVEPKYPYPTWLLDDTALSVLSYGPFMARYGINGFVYSMAHGWGPKPLENLQSYASTNGDGTLLYPSELVGGSGPLPSIRLMLLRDAIEDWELLQNLGAAKNQWIRYILWSEVTLRAIPPSKYWEITAHSYHVFHVTLRQKLSGVDTAVEREDALCGYSDDGQIQIKKIENAPEIDGILDPKIWNDTLKQRELRHPSGVEIGKTDFWCAHDEKNFYAAFRAKAKTFDKDWCAVEIATESATIRYRFVVTAKGTGVVEKHTREGKYRIEGFNWQFSARQQTGEYTVELQIPLSSLESSQGLQANALRRIGDPHTAYIVRLYQDAGDITIMAGARLEN